MNHREVCWHPWLNILDSKGVKEERREKTVKLEQVAELSLERTVLFSS
jgi:hypothetical protein